MAGATPPHRGGIGSGGSGSGSGSTPSSSRAASLASSSLAPAATAASLLSSPAAAASHPPLQSPGGYDAAHAAFLAPASTEDAVHAVPYLLSQLLSGRTAEQVLATRKLLAYCRGAGGNSGGGGSENGANGAGNGSSGDGGSRAVEQAVVAAGGVPLLLIMLDSLDRTLRDVCTRLLTDLAADERVR